MSDLQEPQGVAFFSIKGGETRFAKMEAQIQAYINSSDMGINASRDQDFGWRLHPEWVKKVRAFRRDETKMAALVARNGGQKATTPQVLYAIYGEQLRAYAERQEEEENPFEEDYLAAIREPKAPKVNAPDPLPDTNFDDTALDEELDDLTDDADAAELARMEAQEKAKRELAEKKNAAKIKSAADAKAAADAKNKEQ